MTTELCKQLRKRKDKPHIFLHSAFFNSSELNAIVSTSAPSDDSWMFCFRVNDGFYKTPGDAARAWHNYKAPGAQGNL